MVGKYGLKKWSFISSKLNEKDIFKKRSGKQCRERWHNHLDPQIEKKPWSESETQLIFQLHEELGNKWADIAKAL